MPETTYSGMYTTFFGTPDHEEGKVKKGRGAKHSDKGSSDERTAESENFDRLLVLRRDLCQREGERHNLYGLFGAETD